MNQNYQKTIYACFTGHIVQAIVNNFVPLLFMTFHNTYQIPLSRITALVTMNFGIQLLVDLLSAAFVDRIGYRICMVTAHLCSAAGLILLTVLPEVFPDPFYGLLTAIGIYAIGGGLIEVLISPVMEACPTDNKEKAMSLLHSFYCWGHVAVVLLSTLFFAAFGIENWKILAVFWALIPACNMIAFLNVPIAPLIAEDEEGLSFTALVKNKFFWLFILMMLCAGASEQAVSQWASTFAEQGLHIGKTAGDLAGPMLFALMMGLSRVWYGKYGENINLNRFMMTSTCLCLLSYLMIALVPVPPVGIAGCALCGFSVGIMWPGTFSCASATLRNGGTAMFALLALAGDLGCSGGPTLAGMAAGAFSDNLRTGILAAIVFPFLLLVCILILMYMSGKKAAD